MDIKEIYSKIRKLQALADSATDIGSIAEAETAASAIGRLLEKYNLSLFDVTDTGNTNIDIDCFGDISSRSPYGVIWKRHLLVVLCKFNYCCATVNVAKKRMQVVGTEVNALVVIDMFNSLQSVYLHTAKQSGLKKSEISSFLLGCTAGLRIRLEEETRTSVMYATAMVRCYEVKIDDFLANRRIKSMKQRSRKVAGTAFGAGWETGRNTPTHRTVQQKLF